MIGTVSYTHLLHNHYHEVILYKKDEDIADYWVLQSFQFRYKYKAPQTISIIVPQDLTSDDLQFQIDTNAYLVAPMEKGEQIGTLMVYNQEQCLYSCDMVLSDDLSFTMFELSLIHILRKTYREFAVGEKQIRGTYNESA